jgi:hypothetical protein
MSQGALTEAKICLSLACMGQEDYMHTIHVHVRASLRTHIHTHNTQRDYTHICYHIKSFSERSMPYLGNFSLGRGSPTRKSEKPTLVMAMGAN